MNEKEQIEEMASVIHKARVGKVLTSQDLSTTEIMSATALYTAGYRKQSDTVKEFVEKIQAISLTVSPDQYTPIAYLHSEIKNLAKEYGAEV